MYRSRGVSAALTDSLAGADPEAPVGAPIAGRASISPRFNEITLLNGAGTSDFVIIANAMKTNSLALDRFKSEIESNRGEIEALLAIGVPPQAAVADHVTESVRASLIPVVDAMRTLGLVYIPGMMAGMILGGANPIYAAQYQFVIMGMIFAAGGLTSMTTSLLVGRDAFTGAAQLRRFEESSPTLLSTLRSLR